MKLHRSLKLTLALVAVLAVASSVFAGHRTVFLSEGTTLDGTSIPKGQYDITWKKNGTPDTYDVRILDGTKVVAKTTGQLVDRGEKMEQDKVITKLDGNGGRSIEEIHFRGKSTVLVID
ncbi:MAG: hypothetical protein R3344_03465 [Acidobacteriota bacterium]|nr:hypothetical protein [Acidobacteriota bacterium]